MARAASSRARGKSPWPVTIAQTIAGLPHSWSAVMNGSIFGDLLITDVSASSKTLAGW